MKAFFYLNGDQRVGPVNINELAAARINKETLVWCEGMADWKRAGDVYELQHLFQQQAPQPTQTPQQQQPQQQQYNQQQPNYQQPQQQNYGNYGNYGNTGGTTSHNKPRMGALKVFSIIGMLLSLIVFFVGIGVMNLYASGCYNCDCYPYVRNNEEYGAIIMVSAILMLVFSIVAMVKAFKSY